MLVITWFSDVTAAMVAAPTGAGSAPAASSAAVVMGIASSAVLILGASSACISCPRLAGCRASGAPGDRKTAG